MGRHNLYKWVSFRSASTRRNYDGVGVVLTGNGVAGVDLDSCVIEGVVAEAAKALLARIGCTYIELSPSGTGLRAFGRVDVSMPGKSGNINGVRVELYTRDRYLTFTGHRVEEFGPFLEPLDMMAGFEEVAYLLGHPDSTQATQDTQATQATQETHATKETQSGGPKVNVCPTDIGNCDYPSSCIPNGHGQRNKKIFQLARWLKAKMPDVNEDQLYLEVQKWHEGFVNMIKAKELEFTWADFLTSWNNVERPYGEMFNFLASDLPELPDWMQGQRFGLNGEKLLRLCIALAAHHEPEPFFLSARKAGGYLDHHFTNGATILRGLVSSGYLKLVTPGARRLASTYRIRAPNCAEGILGNCVDF